MLMLMLIPLLMLVFFCHGRYESDDYSHFVAPVVLHLVHLKALVSGSRVVGLEGRTGLVKV